MTKRIEFGAREVHSKVSPEEIAASFNAGEWDEEFALLQKIANRYDLNVRILLLPEVPTDRIDQNLLVWSSTDAEHWEGIRVESLMEMVRVRSGGPVHVGKKGLIFGTSAVECYLSNTNAAYPGDADAVVIDADGNVQYVIEYKKHTLLKAIREHRADSYYPIPDARKYQRLWSLVERFRVKGGADGGLVILYFGTKTFDVCVDIVEGVYDTKLEMGARSEAVNIRGESVERIGRSIWSWLTRY